MTVSTPIDQWNGSEYAKNSLFQNILSTRLIDGIQFNGDETILDVGCGNGKITSLISSKIPHGTIYAVDPSESMLEEARRSCSSDKIHFQKASAEDFSLNEQFDHIFASYVMHWIKDQKKALLNFNKHLKRHGQIHLIAVGTWEGLPYLKALQKTLSSFDSDFKNFQLPMHFLDVAAYKKLLLETGFRPDDIHNIYRNLYHNNADALKKWIAQWQPHAKHLPIDKQNLFLDLLLDNYFQELGCNPAPDEQVHWEEYILFIEATKA